MIAFVTMNKFGKLNSSIDIIPLQGSSNEDKGKSINKIKPDEITASRVMRDPQIVSRVYAVSIIAITS